MSKLEENFHNRIEYLFKRLRNTNDANLRKILFTSVVFTTAATESVRVHAENTAEWLKRIEANPEKNRKSGLAEIESIETELEEQISSQNESESDERIRELVFDSLNAAKIVLMEVDSFQDNLQLLVIKASEHLQLTLSEIFETDDSDRLKEILLLLGKSLIGLLPGGGLALAVLDIEKAWNTKKYEDKVTDKNLQKLSTYNNAMYHWLLFNELSILRLEQIEKEGLEPEDIKNGQVELEYARERLKRRMKPIGESIFKRS